MLNGSETSSRIIFEGRKEYETYIGKYIPWLMHKMPPNIDHNLMDTWYTRSLYGRVDLISLPIAPRLSRVEVIKNEDKPEQYLLEFTYDAFKAFKTYFLRVAGRHGIKLNAFWDGEIERAFSVPTQDYIYFLAAWTEQFWNWFYNNDLGNKPISQKILIQHIMRYQQDVLHEPLTFSGFMQSTHSTIYNTGLALDLNKELFMDDTNKIISYYDKGFFGLYADSARRFGFMIDENAPWRLVADVDSIAMQYFMYRKLDFDQMMERYRFTKNMQAFLLAFESYVGRFTDIEEYMQSATRIPTEAVLDIYFQPTYLKDSGTEVGQVQKTIEDMWCFFKRNQTNKELISASEEPNWLKVYAQLRFIEARKDLNIPQLLETVEKKQIALDNKKIVRYINSASLPW
jgi:hypothetical protein